MVEAVVGLVLEGSQRAAAMGILLVAWVVVVGHRLQEAVDRSQNIAAAEVLHTQAAACYIHHTAVGPAAAA